MMLFEKKSELFTLLIIRIDTNDFHFLLINFLCIVDFSWLQKRLGFCHFIAFIYGISDKIKNSVHSFHLLIKLVVKLYHLMSLVWHCQWLNNVTEFCNLITCSNCQHFSIAVSSCSYDFVHISLFILELNVILWLIQLSLHIFITYSKRVCGAYIIHCNIITINPGRSIELFYIWDMMFFKYCKTAYRSWIII